MTTDTRKRVLSRRKPRESAKMFRDEMRPNLVCQQEEWLDWNGKHYVAVEHSTIEAEIAEWCDDAFEKFLQQVEDKETDEEKQKIAYRKFEPKPADVAAITTSLRHLVHRPAEMFTPPCWLKIEKPYLGIDPADIIVCENGLLDLRTRKLHDHTPTFFTRTSIPIKYEKEAPEPTLWLKSLKQWFQIDDSDEVEAKARQEVADLLQELFGYSLSADTSQQTVIMLWGVPRGGKGTVLRILTNLAGAENVHAPSIKEMSGRFGLQGCIAKSLITITDMNVDEKTELGSAAVNINAISGEDRVSIERKGITPWSGNLPGRIWLLGNTLPDFGSHTTALVARLIVIVFDVSFLGREDRGLTKKLRQELPGILNWALDGLERLRDRGRFPDCAASETAKTRMLYASEPIKGFVEEKCEFGDVHIDKAILYSRYRVHCRSVGVRPMPLHTFAERLMYLYPAIGASKRRASDGSRPPIFDGIRLNEHEAIKLYRLATGCTVHDIDEGLGVDFWSMVARDSDDEPILKSEVETDFAD